MSNCDFYAKGGDFVRILDFVFEQPGWMLVESFSRHDLPLRRFGSRSTLLDAIDLGVVDANLSLYAPSFGGAVLERQIIFQPGAVPEATGRTDAAGWGLIELYLRAPRVGHLPPSHTGHNSEARARRWESTYEGQLGPVDAWDWTAIESASRRLNRFIRGMAVGKLGSRAILPDAAEGVARGETLAANS